MVKISYKQFIFTISLISAILAFSSTALAQNADTKSKIKEVFDDETKLTTVILQSIKLPDDKDSLGVGAMFRFEGKTLEDSPCCVSLFFTAFAEKGFKFKENHKLEIIADQEKFKIAKVFWQENYYAINFIIGGFGYPEEVFAEMDRETFSKIADAKNVKVELGGSKFELTAEQLTGLKEISEKMFPVK